MVQNLNVCVHNYTPIRQISTSKNAKFRNRNYCPVVEKMRASRFAGLLRMHDFNSNIPNRKACH